MSTTRPFGWYSFDVILKTAENLKLLNVICHFDQAIAMYPYQSTDDDELNFSKNDIIYVVEFPDPEEQVSKKVKSFCTSDLSTQWRT